MYLHHDCFKRETMNGVGIAEQIGFISARWLRIAVFIHMEKLE